MCSSDLHKIVIAGLTDEWNDACYNWVIDSLSKKMNLAPEKFPNISVLKQKNDWAFPRTCNHPNALVLLEGVDNSDAIKYFIERQQGKVLH